MGLFRNSNCNGFRPFAGLFHKRQNQCQSYQQSYCQPQFAGNCATPQYANVGCQPAYAGYQQFSQPVDPDADFQSMWQFANANNYGDVVNQAGNQRLLRQMVNGNLQATNIRYGANGQTNARAWTDLNGDGQIAGDELNTYVDSTWNNGRWEVVQPPVEEAPPPPPPAETPTPAMVVEPPPPLSEPAIFDPSTSAPTPAATEVSPGFDPATTMPPGF